MSTTLDPAPSRPEARPSASPWRPLLLRLHFYAGLFVAPFIAVAAVTGLLFVFTPQIENAVYHHELRVDPAGRDVLSLDQQVAAARATWPDLSVIEVQPNKSAGHTTRVVFWDDSLEGGNKQRTTFVDPYTAEVRGSLVTWWGESPLVTWLDVLHMNLHLGDSGTLYSELAASWLWVISLVGLFLWWQHLRGRRTARGKPVGLRRWVVPDLRARGVRRTMNWHGTTGVWIILGLLVLAVTGLTWSTYAGSRFESLLDQLHAHRPAVDAAMSAPVVVEEPLTYDEVEASAAGAGMRRPWIISPPADDSSAWVVTENDHQWKVQADVVAIDPVTGTVNERLAYADWPFLAQLSQWGIFAHMGQAFGLLNQLLLTALAIGLLCVIFWGYRMWWQRRPTRGPWGVGKPPARGGWRRIPPTQLAIALVVVLFVGWALPVFGLSLVAFLLVDLVVGAVKAARTSDPDPEPEPEPEREPEPAG